MSGQKEQGTGKGGDWCLPFSFLSFPFACSPSVSFLFFFDALFFAATLPPFLLFISYYVSECVCWQVYFSFSLSLSLEAEIVAPFISSSLSCVSFLPTLWQQAQKPPEATGATSHCYYYFSRREEKLTAALALLPPAQVDGNQVIQLPLLLPLLLLLL